MPSALTVSTFAAAFPTLASGYLLLLGGEAAHRLVIRELCLIEPAHGQGQRIGVFVELGLGRELVSGELLRPVIGLLPQGQIRGGAVDLSFTLGDNFGTRPDLDALQFRIGHGFFGFGLAQLGDQFGIVDNQKGRTRRDFLTTADRDLRQPAGDARGDVDPRARRFLPARAAVRGARDTRSPNR